MFSLLFSNQVSATENNNLDNIPEEDLQILFEVLDGSRIYYDDDNNFVGINEHDLSELKETEQEYLIEELREEGMLHNPSTLFSTNPHDQLREEILNLGDEETRAAHGQCMIDNLGGNVAESVATAIVNDFRAADVRGIISNLGRAGFNMTIPGLTFTILQCGVESEN